MFMLTDSRSKRWRILRRCLFGVAAFLTLIAAFYTEEGWRGQRAWENCKRALEAKGVKMNWTDYIPAPVPDNENVFAVPEMRKLFVGEGATEFASRVSEVTSYNLLQADSVRVVAAKVEIGLPGATLPSGFAALAYGDPQARAEARRLMKEALGPMVLNPNATLVIKRRPDEIQPAKIWLQCQTTPSVKEMEQFLGKNYFLGGEVEPASGGSYRLTLTALSAAGCLARSASLEPDFAVMQQALKRPHSRLEGQYLEPVAGLSPIYHLTELARTLAAMAQCHLLQGQPEEALRDLSLMHDLCRIHEVQPGAPYALVTTLSHMVVMATDASVISDGLALHAWREPQLVALQEQLKGINFVPVMRQVWLGQPALMSHSFESLTPYQLGLSVLGLDYIPHKTNAWSECAASVIGNVIPRGWVYQNMVKRAIFYQALSDCTDSSGQMIFPNKVEAAVRVAGSHASPSTFLGYRGLLSVSQRVMGTAQTQTRVHEAIIACALERYRLAHDAYPETLEALVPQFLTQIPRDVIGGQPLHYRRADGGKFALYSVGWNGTDDGGKPGSEDDWLWQSYIETVESGANSR